MDLEGGKSRSCFVFFFFQAEDGIRDYKVTGVQTCALPISKLMAALYLTLRGTPILYYGEELGMENNDPKSKDEVKDPIGKLGWPLEKGRDGERTPMQWSDGPNAGFSKATPWLPVPPSAKTHNVATEKKDPNSVLSFYRQLLALRHQQAALLDGKYIPLNEDDPNVLSYLRQYKDESILVVLKMSDRKSTRLNSSHLVISYAVFCLKKKKKKTNI